MHSHWTLNKVNADDVGAWFQTHLTKVKLNFYSYSDTDTGQHGFPVVQSKTKKATFVDFTAFRSRQHQVSLYKQQDLYVQLIVW